MNRRSLLIALLAALAGCATLAETRYYSLSSRPLPAGLANPGNETAGYRVAIGPVSVPEVLDRLQIVLRIAPNRYDILDTDRWIEPLKRGIPHAIAEQVGQRLHAARVASYQQHGGQDADYRVLIDVLRLDSVPGESATLEAVWAVRNRSGERLREMQFVLVERVQAAGVAPLVAAHRKALAALSRQIADVVSELAKAKQ